MNQSELGTKTRNRREARENGAFYQVTIGLVLLQFAFNTLSTPLSILMFIKISTI